MPFDVTTVTETIVYGGPHTCNHSEPLKMPPQTLFTFAHMKKRGGFPDVSGKSVKMMEELFKTLGLPAHIGVKQKAWRDTKLLIA